MEVKKISDELERIIESKRIPNALIFETDGLNSELEMSLEFAKKILLSNEQNPVNQNRLVKELDSLSYPLDQNHPKRVWGRTLSPDCPFGRLTTGIHPK